MSGLASTASWTFCEACRVPVLLPHLCPTRTYAQRLDDSAALTAVVAAVKAALAELSDGEQATTSRDFGRGMAHACRHVSQALADALDAMATYALNPLNPRDNA